MRAMMKGYNLYNYQTINLLKKSTIIMNHFLYNINESKKDILDCPYRWSQGLFSYVVFKKRSKQLLGFG